VLPNEDSCPRTNFLAPCRVSRHWRIAATDILYEFIAPRSLRSAELLLRTLRKDKEAVLGRRIKVLHLPMIDYPPFSDHMLSRCVVYDESGIPTLSGYPPAKYLHLIFDDLRYLSRIITAIIARCSHLVELHAPVLDSLTRLGPLPQVLTLRRLIITGFGTLLLLFREILLKVDSSTLYSLEVLAVYRTYQSSTWHGGLRNKAIELHGRPLLPNLRAFHLQDGYINVATVFELLNILGSTLNTLTLQNLQLSAPGIVVSSDMEPSFPKLKMLVIDIDALRCLCRVPSIAFQDIDASLLRKAPNLHTFELRLLSTTEVTDNRFRTSGNWTVETFPVGWRWVQSIPSSLQVLRMISYTFPPATPDSSCFRSLTNHPRNVADGLRLSICQGRPDLESLQLDLIERNPT
jgi:hypothetical protein